jgi:23S rRNA pseudoU1915 N3-methylase RlmH
LFGLENFAHRFQALRLVHIREEKTQRQAQLEERIIDPENDELAPSKVKGSKASSSKRGRVASSKRFASNLTPGDLDGRYKLDDEEDLSAVYAPNNYGSFHILK